MLDWFLRTGVGQAIINHYVDEYRNKLKDKPSVIAHIQEASNWSHEYSLDNTPSMRHRHITVTQLESYIGSALAGTGLVRKVPAFISGTEVTLYDTSEVPTRYTRALVNGTFNRLKVDLSEEVLEKAQKDFTLYYNRNILDPAVENYLKKRIRTVWASFWAIFWVIICTLLLTGEASKLIGAD